MKQSKNEISKTLEEIIHQLTYIENDIKNFEKRIDSIEDFFNDLYHRY